LDADLTNLLERAELDARRRRHDAVDPEHLLSVILEEDAVSRALVVRGVDPIELRDSLEAALTSRPITAGFRDAATVSLETSDALDDVLESLDDDGVTVLDALFLDRTVARLLLGLRQCSGARHVLERTTALAVVAGDELIRVEHLLQVLLDVVWFEEAVRRTSMSLDTLRAAIVIAPNKSNMSNKKKPLRKTPKWSDTIVNLLRDLSPNREYEKLRVDDLARALIVRRTTREILERYGIKSFELLYSVVHESGVPDPDSEPTTQAFEQVFLHDDPITSHTFGRDVLENAFELLPAEAEKILQMAERNDEALIQTFPTKEARKRWRTALRMCEHAVQPMRFSTRRP